MKILHIIPSLDVAKGGPSRAALDMVRALNEKGFQADILTAGEKSSTSSDPIRDGNVFEFNSRFGSRWGFSTALSGWLAKHARHYDVFHIHSFFSFTTVVAVRQAQKKQIPYIIRPAGALDRHSRRQKLSALPLPDG